MIFVKFQYRNISWKQYNFDTKFPHFVELCPGTSKILQWSLLLFIHFLPYVVKFQISNLKWKQEDCDTKMSHFVELCIAPAAFTRDHS